jgi:hypothetical protein
VVRRRRAPRIGEGLNIAFHGIIKRKLERRAWTPLAGYKETPA